MGQGTTNMGEFESTTPGLNGVKSENKRWHLVIVGGGFGGLRAAQALKSAVCHERCAKDILQ